MLQQVVAVGGWPARAEVHAAPLLAPWQRRIVIGLLLAWLGLLAMLESVPWQHWNAAWCGGFLLALPCLLAGWVSFREGPVTLGLPAVLALTALFGLSNCWSHVPDSESQAAYGQLLLSMPATLLLTAVFVLLRRLGWRLRLCGHQHGREVKGVQFSLRRILSWTTGTAAILSLARWISPDWRIGDDNWVELAIWVTVLGAIALLLAIVFAPAAWLVLGEHGQRRSAARTALATASSATVLCLAVCCVDNDLELRELAVEAAMFIGAVHLGFLTVALGALIVLRQCGYRLVQSGGSRSPEVSPAITPASGQLAWQVGQQQPEFQANSSAARFAWTSGLLVLALAALLWPAHAVHMQRSRLAQDRELERQWSALGVTVQVDEGRIVELSPREPISQAALDKLLCEADKICTPALVLSGQPIADDQLCYLAGLQQLRYLRLDRTGITDAGLVHLTSLSGLQELDLAGTQVTDEGLKILAPMASLTTLGLDRTAVTDAGLAHLEPLERLKVIYLAETRATPAGIAAFQSTSPNRCVMLQGLDAVLAQMQRPTTAASAGLSPR